MSTVAWLAGAGASIAVGMAALSLIGDDALAQTPPVAPALPDPTTTSADTDDAATGQPATTPPAGTPFTPSRPTSVSTVSDRVLTSSAGSVVARCVAGEAFLVSWSPGWGYRVDSVRRGPAPAAWAVFEGGGREVVVTVRCVSGVPQAQVTQERDDFQSPPAPPFGR